MFMKKIENKERLMDEVCIRILMAVNMLDFDRITINSELALKYDLMVVHMKVNINLEKNTDKEFLVI